MCDTNHGPYANAGYLFNVRGESVAPPGALYTRMLANHREVGLTADQITALLDLNRDYHLEQVDIWLEMARLGEEVELKHGRISDEDVNTRKLALDRRAELFAAGERLFFRYAAAGQALLTDEQITTANAIYHAEKDDGLQALAGALSSAVAPTYTFQPA